MVNASHPSTSMLPAEWHVQDEMLAPMIFREHFRGLKSPFAGTISNQIPGRSAPLWSFQPMNLPTRVYPVSLSRHVSYLIHVHRPWSSSVRSGDTTPNRCAEQSVFFSDVSMLRLHSSLVPGAWSGFWNGTTAGRSFYTSLGHLNETWQVRSSYGLGLNDQSARVPT